MNQTDNIFQCFAQTSVLGQKEKAACLTQLNHQEGKYIISFNLSQKVKEKLVIL